MLDFLRCVAQAVMEKGARGFADMVPGGGYACDVAQLAWKRYRERKRDAEVRAELGQMARASFDEARRAAAEAAREAAGGATPPIELELYLAQIPAAVQQSLKRPDDPSGTTVPADFALRSADDVLKLLPPRPPRLRPGDPLPGKPGWVLDRPLGAGGFGEVWLARHPTLASLCGAVKFCQDLSARDRDLLHEGRVIDRVMQLGKHPNIVPLLDAHLEGDAPWLMFEYVPGGDLADQIRGWQGLPAAERVAKASVALAELAEAVGHFHGLTPAVVHRDLKPSNVLRDATTGRLRVTDFGIGAVTAKLALDAETRGATTRGGRLLSYLRGSYSPLYSSPQQRDGADPDPRDDVHALGVIGYQMFTGNLTQGGGTDFADDLREAGVGEEMIALLARCVAQKADRRPESAAHLLEQLRGAGARPPAAPAPPPAAPPPITGAAHRPPAVHVPVPAVRKPSEAVELVLGCLLAPVLIGLAVAVGLLVYGSWAGGAIVGGLSLLALVGLFVLTPARGRARR